MLKELSQEEARVFISKGNGIIADVRDRESYDKDHIPNAIHFSMSKLKEFTKKSDKNQPVLLYCYHGINSKSVAQHLVEQGFLQVCSLMGGFAAWGKYLSSSSDT